MILRIVVYGVVAFLLAPLAVIVLFSFHASAGLSFPFTGFSLRWYAEMFGNEQLIHAIILSLKIAAAAAIVTLLLGSLAALAWLRLGARGRGLLEFLCLTPIALPGLFLGVSLLVLFAQLRIGLSTITIVIAHVLLALPLMIVAMKTRLALFDPMLEEAAHDLGASNAKTFRAVTLPIIAPTLLASAVLAFAISFDEFVVTSFVAGTDTTLPMFVWSMMRRTVTPLINAISTLALAVSMLALGIAWIIARLRRHGAMAGRGAPEEPETS
jgi:spermidine/putrescine transport system permease protein